MRRPRGGRGRRTVPDRAGRRRRRRCDRAPRPDLPKEPPGEDDPASDPRAEREHDQIVGPTARARRHSAIAAAFPSFSTATRMPSRACVRCPERARPAAGCSPPRATCRRCGRSRTASRTRSRRRARRRAARSPRRSPPAAPPPSPSGVDILVLLVPRPVGADDPGEDLRSAASTPMTRWCPRAAANVPPPDAGRREALPASTGAAA